MATLLIADDNPEILELYQDEFESDGYNVITAADGNEALSIARDKKPDLVILDIGMPEKNGLEVIGEISRLHGGTPVIVNTAYPLFKMDFRAHHATAWIEKSSNLDPLRSAVRQLVEP
ncbi:MAG TPA: response regulator [bacterium]|nr:response regulator [bacterium]